MEFLVLASRYVRKPGRERVVMQAVMEAAETLGADRVEARKGNVYSIGVYLKDGERKTLVYIDWDKEDWDWKRVYSHIVGSTRVPSILSKGYEINMKA